MARINKEEYEILKDLDSKWNWIARDEMGVLDCYMKKPKKYKLILKFWSDNISPPKYIDGSNFQFIQWEDEKPYNIQELIDEYESEYHIENAKIVNIDVSKLTPWTPNPLDFESEETEVKKDKKWFVDKWTEERNGTDVHDPMYHFINEFIKDIKQLDEPEVLSREWIAKNSTLGQFATNEVIYFDKFVKADKLKNLLVPKHEELESKIQELIETYEQEDGQYSNPENAWIAGFIGDLENLVEEEQKYYVINNDQRVMLVRMMDGKTITEADPFKLEDMYEVEKKSHRLTEQEIKDYDERYWAFAVKVEEMEE